MSKNHLIYLPVDVTSYSLLQVKKKWTKNLEFVQSRQVNQILRSYKAYKNAVESLRELKN